MFDVTAIRKDFPILSRKVNGRQLVYLDNAATSQKPQQVIDSIVDYYSNYNANIHRGVHALSQEATDVYEASRKKITNAFWDCQTTRGNFHFWNHPRYKYCGKWFCKHPLCG